MKAVQGQRVVAHDQVGMQADLLADRGHVAQRLRGHRGAVADAAAQDNHVVAAAHRDLAVDQRDHAPAPASSLARGAQLAWQMATASASAAWSGRGSSASPSSVLTIRATWSLGARPLPQTAPLTCWGV